MQAGRCAGDTRTRAQQLADALVQLADLALAGGALPTLRTAKPHVLITTGADDLLAAAAHPARAGTAGPAGPDVAASCRRHRPDRLRRAAVHRRAPAPRLRQQLTRILLDPDGMPIHHGRTHRVASPQLRRIVVLNDQHCVFAGCSAPHYWCDVHHVVHWLDGGETCPQNSGLLCERHHTQVHHGFRIERDPTADGTPTAPTAPRSSSTHRCAPETRHLRYRPAGTGTAAGSDDRPGRPASRTRR